MVRSSKMPGGELELAVMNALWDLGRATGRQVHERVGLPQGLVYTTIAKVLDRLHAKKMVARNENGTAFVYRPLVARGTVAQAQARDLISRLLGGAPAPAMASLVDALEEVDPDLLDELAREVEARRTARRGS